MKNPAVLAAVIALFVAGCSMVGFDQKLYEAQRLELFGSRDALVELVVAYARAQNWVIVSTSVGPNAAVEALSPSVDVVGMGMRNRWFFWVEDNEVKAELRLEVRFDPAVDVWESSPVLCDTYEYQDEQRHLQKLAEFAGKRRPSQVAALGSAKVRN